MSLEGLCGGILSVVALFAVLAPFCFLIFFLVIGWRSLPRYLWRRKEEEEEKSLDFVNKSYPVRCNGFPLLLFLLCFYNLDGGP